MTELEKALEREKLYVEALKNVKAHIQRIDANWYTKYYTWQQAHVALTKAEKLK